MRWRCGARWSFCSEDQMYDACAPEELHTPTVTLWYTDSRLHDLSVQGTQRYSWFDYLFQIIHPVLLVCACTTIVQCQYVGRRWRNFWKCSNISKVYLYFYVKYDLWVLYTTLLKLSYKCSRVKVQYFPPKCTRVKYQNMERSSTSTVEYLSTQMTWWTV